ncbi:MAG: NADH-quinone oxidoreductase subunit N [Gemmatimonadaceae bacterium]|nr:NADH-quinone oxidoreductase subunit N [Gemmatimonadaceae bacterium]
MTFDLMIPGQLIGALLPDVVLMGGAMLLMLLAAWRRESDAWQRVVAVGALAVLAAAAAAVLWMMRLDADASIGVIAVDRFRWATDLLCIVGAGFAIALMSEQNPRARLVAGEAHVLVLLATAGMMIMAAARDLMILFLGIELMSIAVYVLVAMDRRRERSAEAGLKYFLLGAFSTAFLLYGVALIYGATGTTNLTEIGARIILYKLADHPMLLFGVAFLLIGFGFKVAAAPFHMWSPDVYEGAPTPVTAFMAAAVKAAAFAAFLRIWIEAFPMVVLRWFGPIWWIAALTMVVGNIVALSQKNVKRMLAYSSIAHSGYLLVAIASTTSMGSSAFLFYLLAYTLATFGAFAVVSVVSDGAERGTQLSDYEGLWQSRPWLAVGMTVFLLALLGFPVFGGMGFFAKWYLLQAAIASPAPLVTLSVILVLTSVVSAGYYLHLVRVMFMKERDGAAAAVPASGPLTRLVLITTAVLILVMGVAPERVATWSRLSAIGPAPSAISSLGADTPELMPPAVDPAARR